MKHVNRIHILFILGVILAICGLAPLLLYSFGVENPLWAIGAIGLGIILFVVGLITRAEEFEDY